MRDEISNEASLEAGAASARSAASLTAILWFAGLVWWLAIPHAPGYSFDDREAIVGNPVVEGALPASAAFDRDYWHHLSDAGHYRPLATLALRMDAAAVDTRSAAAPARFRRTNLGLQLLVLLTLGLGLIRIQRNGGPTFPWFGLALFAVHPASADAVAWISGRTSLLSGLGAALGVLLLPFGTHRRALAMCAVAGLVGALIALLAKEDGLVVAAALPAVAWAMPSRSDGHGKGRWRRGVATLAGAGAAVLLVAWLRSEALGSPLPSAPSAPLAAVPLLERIAMGVSAWWQGVTAAATPWASHPPSLTPADVLPAGGSLPSPAASLIFGDELPGPGLGGAMALLAAIYWVVRRDAAARLSLGLSFLCTLPLLQVVPAGELFAPRFLYQPLLFGVFWVSALARGLTGGLGKPFGTGLLILLLCGLAWCSIERSAPVYDSRESYWRAHLPQHGNDAKIWNALGECRREGGDLEEARAFFLRSTELDPRYSRPLGNLGALEAKAGDLSAAEDWFEQAIFEGPGEAAPRANLATILLRQDRAEEALDLYRDAARLAPGRATYHRGMARAALALGDLAAARAALDRAVELAPLSPLTRSLTRRLTERLPASVTEAEAEATH